MKMIPMNVRRLLTATAGFAALTVLAGCGTSPTGSGDAVAQPVRVVAAVYPYQWLVEQIGGAEVQVRSHVEGALKAGNSKEQIVCALVHAGCYMGIPRLFNALNACKDLLSERDAV